MSRDLMVAIRDLGEASGERGFVAIVPGPEGRYEVRTSLPVAVAYEMLKRAVEMMEEAHSEAGPTRDQLTEEIFRNSEDEIVEEVRARNSLLSDGQ